MKHDEERRHIPNKRNYVNLYIDNINVADYHQIRDGYAKPLQLIETGTKGYIYIDQWVLFSMRESYETHI